jgi:hypothetical protein
MLSVHSAGRCAVALGGSFCTDNLVIHAFQEDRQQDLFWNRWHSLQAALHKVKLGTCLLNSAAGVLSEVA